MCPYLFVYGTLLPGCAPEEIAWAASQLRLVGEASVIGDLYDLGHFPGAVPGEDPRHTISGLLFELPEDDSVLRALYEYEEFFPYEPQKCQFRRVACEAQLMDGSSLPCWIYVYVRALSGVPRIQDGIWRGPAM